MKTRAELKPFKVLATVALDTGVVVHLVQAFAKIPHHKDPRIFLESVEFGLAQLRIFYRVVAVSQVEAEAALTYYFDSLRKANEMPEEFVSLVIGTLPR